MKSIKLYTFKEKRPDNEAVITYFTSDYMGFCEVRVGKVEYFWDDENGSSVSYSGEESSEEISSLHKNGYKLFYSVDGVTGLEESDDHWVDCAAMYDEELEDTSDYPSGGR